MAKAILASRTRAEVILLDLELVRLHLESCVQAEVPHYEEGYSSFPQHTSPSNEGLAPFDFKEAGV